VNSSLPMIMLPDEAVYMRENKRAAVSEELQPQHYACFRGLRDSGHLVHDGMRFGADFIAYEADPSLCHSKYTCHVVEAVRMRDLCAMVRLANNAKKLCVLSMGKTFITVWYEHLPQQHQG